MAFRVVPSLLRPTMAAFQREIPRVPTHPGLVSVFSRGAPFSTTSTSGKETFNGRLVEQRPTRKSEQCNNGQNAEKDKNIPADLITLVGFAMVIGYIGALATSEHMA